MELDALRLEIDGINDEILELFVKRMDISLKIAKYKKENGLPILNADRERDILLRMSKQAGPELASYAVDFFNGLFELSRSYQSSNLYKYGLVGENLSYSYSKLIHEKLDDYKYELFNINKADFGNFIESRNFDGLNITVPYKKAVKRYCDGISGIASKIGSVNTVYIKDGKLIGTNTDYDGFLYMLKRSGISLKGKKVLILGGGGTGLTVKKCARDEGALRISTAQRNHDFSKDQNAQIIVNATPVGTFPNNGGKIIDLADFPKCEGVLDVVYNPLRTDLLLSAKELGIPRSNGLPMLVAQATAAAELFTGKNYESKNEEILNWLLSSIQNIVLIGMPGAGKSSVGKRLSELTGRVFVDLDDAVVKSAGMSIPDIFAKHGEKAFRDIETLAAKEYGKQNNLVIAAGGGAVVRKENMDALMQNGVVFFLDRDVEKLETDGRPLSKNSDALWGLYEERLPLYKKYSDYVVDCSESIEEACAAIMRSLPTLPEAASSILNP